MVATLGALALLLLLLLLLLDPQPLAQDAAASSAAAGTARDFGVWGQANMNRPLFVYSPRADARRPEAC